MEKDRACIAQGLTIELLVLLTATALGTAAAFLLRSNAAIAPWLFSWLVLLCFFVTYHGWRHNNSYKQAPALAGFFVFGAIQIFIATMLLGARLFSVWTYYDIDNSAAPAYLLVSLMCAVLLVWISTHPGGALHRLLNSGVARLLVVSALLLLGCGMAWLVDRSIQ